MYSFGYGRLNTHYPMKSALQRIPTQDNLAKPECESADECDAVGESLRQSLPRYSLRKKVQTLWNNAVIEPVLWLYMMGAMVTNVAAESFYSYKACRADLHFDGDTCRNFWRNNSTYLINPIQVSVLVAII